MHSIEWNDNHLRLLDQRMLPHKSDWLELYNHYEVAKAIQDMAVRGAPAIAIAASYGLALAVQNGDDRTEATKILLQSRPTAVNLQWALNRLSTVADVDLLSEAKRIHAEDLKLNHSIGRHGASVLHGGVLTICNTGALATGGHGTALGMIRTAHSNGKNIHVYILETRPYLQGARLTAFECLEEGIPCTLITDGMAGALLKSGRVQSAVAGCDRVAANGDTANKIGTYQMAQLCHVHDVPLFIAMPTTTLDRQCSTGSEIPIEVRPSTEVRSIQGIHIAPKNIPVWNPSFDVTPAKLISGWVTEFGIWQPPFPETEAIGQTD